MACLQLDRVLSSHTCLLAHAFFHHSWFCPHVNIPATERITSAYDWLVRIRHLLVVIDPGADMTHSVFTKPRKDCLESSQLMWSFCLCGWLCHRNRTENLLYIQCILWWRCHVTDQNNLCGAALGKSSAEYKQRHFHLFIEKKYSERFVCK